MPILTPRVASRPGQAGCPGYPVRDGQAHADSSTNDDIPCNVAESKAPEPLRAVQGFKDEDQA
jgi:hypothetical protein